MTTKTTLLYFPQWQGSGLTNHVRLGAETLQMAFGVETVAIPLSDEPLTVSHNISGYQPLVTQLETAKRTLAHLEPDRLLLVAGDCAAEIAPISYLNRLYQGELTVLWLDAHADLNSPDSSPSGHFHGMPLRLLLDGQFSGTSLFIDSPLTNRQVVFVGLRDTDKPEADYIAEHALPVVTDTHFSPKQVDELLSQRQAKNLYVHLDLDVLNPELFPALQCPVSGGFSPETIAQLIGELINKYNVVGLSLTETTATHVDDLQSIQPILRTYQNWLANA